jgi:hypothetical protein
MCDSVTPFTVTEHGTHCQRHTRDMTHYIYHLSRLPRAVYPQAAAINNTQFYHSI